MPPFSHLVLLAAVVPVSLALPTDRSHAAASPWRRLRDGIVQKIWMPPQRSLSRTCSSERPFHWDLRARYVGDVVLRFQIASREDSRAIAEAADMLYMDMWESTAEWVDIRIAKDMIPSFLGLLPSSLHNAHTLLIQDLAQRVYETYPCPAQPTQKFLSTESHEVMAQPSQGRELFFHEFQPLSVIDPWLRFMASAFPDHAEHITVGTSSEGREIAALRLGSQKSTTDEKAIKTVLITGGSHAREWISVSTVNYIAYSLMTRYGKYPGVTKFLDTHDVVFIPTLNPDGYVYTWESDRLWRKNRQDTTLPFCKGVDLDRAFGYEWDGTNTKDNPCSETFAGDEAFSASEARHVAQWARNQTNEHKMQIVSFLDFHSYSQQILYPYSYSCRDMPSNLEDLEEVAMGLSKGFRMTNNYFYGITSACEAATTTLESGSNFTLRSDVGGGSALDWFYHELSVRFSYQIKLRDTGSYGFLLPKTQIVPTGQEAFNGVMKLAKFLLGNNGIESTHPAITEQRDDGVDWDNEYILPAEKLSMLA